MDYKELAARTHLDERRIIAVMNRDFDALAGANVNMTLRILERELGMDFTQWKEQYELWLKEHAVVNEQPKIAPKVQAFNANSRDFSSKNNLALKILSLLIAVCALVAVVVYYEPIKAQVFELLGLKSQDEITKTEPKSPIQQANVSVSVQSEAEDKPAQASENASSQAIINQPTEANQPLSNAASNEVASSSLVSSEPVGAVSINALSQPETKVESPIEAKPEAKVEPANNPAQSANLSAEASNVASEQKQPVLDNEAVASADESDEQKAKDIMLIKNTDLSIVPNQIAWLNIKDLATHKVLSFSIKSPYKLKSPSLVFVGTTAYWLNIGSKKLDKVGRYFIYDEKGVRFLSKAEYAQIDKSLK